MEARENRTGRQNRRYQLARYCDLALYINIKTRDRLFEKLLHIQFPVHVAVTLQGSVLSLYTHTHIYTHIYIHTYIHTYMHTYIHVTLHVSMRPYYHIACRVSVASNCVHTKTIAMLESKHY